MNGFQIQKIIYQSERIQVSKAIRELDGKSVVLKSLNGEFPSLRDTTRFKYEFELSERAFGTGIVPVLDLHREGNRLILVMEDVGGIPLLDYWNSTPKTLSIFLNLSVQVTTLLGNLHEKGILHKDIKPANILVQKETEKVYFIDLGLASLLQSEEQAPVQPETLEGTLSYISPEQTGRMNRNIDYRSDLYSLGITFYEILTGELPFQGSDPLELVHAHIAVSPKPPIEKKGDIPVAISNLILKLLSKNAEDRYLSANGLLEDLELARELLLNHKPIEFIPGERESRGTFSIPQKLYGREAEVSFLLDAFERIASSNERVPEEDDTESYGGTKLVLVGGYSGVGKTALINEVHKPILEKRGYFLSGKFDQFKRNIPYYSLIQAFTGLVRQILTEKEEKIERWKTHILNACRPNVILLTDLIPELIHITGTQPPLNELSPREAEDRFQKTLQDFVGVFASIEHPLVIFLDDLQWADLPTLKFLESIVLKNEIHHLLLIGAYRDNEVDALHPFTLMVQTIEKGSIPILKIILSPLMEFFIERMICDTLHREVGSELPELVYKKTGGNPFFVRQLLTTLYRDKHLYYSKESIWEVDLEGILQTGYSENVVEVVANRLKELSPETQEVLKVASCIGDRFELSILSQVLQKTLRDSAKLLQEASREGTILPLNETYKTAETLDLEYELILQEVIYKFIHDRVQQAANSLLSEEERNYSHVKIGISILKGIDPESINENIFEIVNHLNYGLSTLETLEEESLLFDLNYKAGIRASESFAYESALNYFDKAIILINEDTKKELRFQCKFEYYKSLHKIGKAKEVNEKLDSLLEECNTKYDKALVYNLKVVCQTNLGEYENSVLTCCEAIRLFGININNNITGKDILLYYKSLSKRLKEKSDEDIFNLPIMDNKEIMVVNEILMNTIIAAYWKLPSYSSIFSFIMLDLSLEHGISFGTPLALAFYGSFLSTMSDYQNAYNYGQIGLKISQKVQNNQGILKITNTLGTMINNWIVHSKFSVSLIINTFESNLNIKDIVYAASMLTNAFQISYLIGSNFSNLRENFKQYIIYLQKNQAVDPYYFCNYLNSFTGVLLDEELVFTDYNNNIISELDYSNILMNSELKISLYFYLIHKLYLNLILGNIDESFHSYKTLLPLRNYGIGQLNSSHDIYASSLLLLKLNLKDPENSEVDFTKDLESNLRQYKKWSEINPDNFKHKYNLILAEYARFKKEYWDASLYYDIALESASENEYNLDAGLCSELAGEFYLEQNRFQFAKKYFQISLYYYDLCGAKAKINHVRSLYPEYTSDDINRTDKGNISSSSPYSTIERTQNQSLDIQTILKVNQALSQEINLENLLKKLLNITIENAGATRSLLLIYEGENLLVEAEGRSENNEIKIFKNLTVKRYTEIPQSLIQYAVRTSKTIIIDSVMDDTQFAQNPYLQRERILSVIIISIVSKRKKIGYLYLENKLIKGAFTKDRIETLNLITAQAAISIENAKLYESMEEKVRNRTIEFENANNELNIIKTELESEKSQMERLQFMSQEVQKKTSIQEILQSLEDIIWDTYKISDYMLYTINPTIQELEIFYVCKHWNKYSLKEKLRNIPLNDKKSIHNLVAQRKKSLFLPKLKEISNGDSEDFNRSLLGIESTFIIPCLLNSNTFAIFSFGDISLDLSRDPSVRSVKNLSLKQRNEVQQLVSLLANSLYQSLQKKELENQKKSIEELNKFIKSLNESHDFDKILERTKSYINIFFNIDHYAIGITDEEKTFVRFLDTSANATPEIKEQLRILKVPIIDIIGAHAFAYKANKPFYIKNVKSNRVTNEEKLTIEIFKFKSFLIIPLILNGNLIGFLDLFNDNKELILTKEQINQLSILAEQLAGIIYSSNLYQELQIQKQQLESTLTELQATQAQLVEAEKSAALGQLISGVAHEINNPLAAIRSSAEILEMDQARILEDIPKFFQSASPEKLSLFLELQDQSSRNRRYLPSREERQRKKQIRSTFETIPFESSTIKEETVELVSELFLEDSYPKLKERFTETEALQILQMLSLFSTQKNALKNIRLSTEKSARVIFSLRKFLGTDIKGTPRQIRISDLLESSLRTYDNYIQGIVQVEKDFTGDTEIVCVVDDIQQVLKNLIFNAIQSMYASPLKKLKIVVQKVNTESGEKRKISIEDSGIGVGEDVVQKLFTPFFTTKSRGEGIGLGLYVSKLIVEEHGGKLEYEEVEGGSRFSVWI